MKMKCKIWTRPESEPVDGYLISGTPIIFGEVKIPKMLVLIKENGRLGLFTFDSVVVDDSEL